MPTRSAVGLAIDTGELRKRSLPRTSAVCFTETGTGLTTQHAQAQLRQGFDHVVDTKPPSSTWPRSHWTDARSRS